MLLLQAVVHTANILAVFCFVLFLKMVVDSAAVTPVFTTYTYVWISHCTLKVPLVRINKNEGLLES